jgi:hypothetical protein
VLPIPYPVNCLTPAATAAPGTPLNVVAVAGPSQATVSWSPAQINQPVTSYTVHNSFASNNLPVADVTVTPVAGSNFPPTSVVIGGLDNSGLVGYAFEVSATNAAGTSALSAQSNTVFPPGVVPPPAPTNVQAIPGDTQASVTFTVPQGNGGSPITSYTVTAFLAPAGTPTGITVTIPPPPAGSNIGRALVGGLTNGTSYFFTVHASNIAVGTPNESLPSNAVTPSAAFVPTLTLTMTGPTSVTTTPTQITYNITVSNPITATQAFPAPNVTVTHTLTPVTATIAAVNGVTRAVNPATGVMTVTVVTTTAHGMNIGQQVIIAGVVDPSFNGTFTILDVPNALSFTFAQSGVAATSGSGSVTGLPLANIQVAQASQGSCTSGGTGVISVACSGISLDPGTSAVINVIVQIQNQAILNTAVASGTDFAGTALPNSSASVTTTVPLSGVSVLSAPVSIAGNAQVPNPNKGQSGNITFTVSNTSTTVAPNVVLTIVVPAGLTINSIAPPTVNNGGVAVCNGPALPANGGTIICTTASLGGSLKNGNKPPQTMNAAFNVTNPLTTVTGTKFPVTGTVTFGPGGIDTLASSVTVTITSR